MFFFNSIYLNLRVESLVLRMCVTTEGHHKKKPPEKKPRRPCHTLIFVWGGAPNSILPSLPQKKSKLVTPLDMPPVLRRRAGDAEVSDEEAASSSDAEVSDDEQEFQQYVEDCKWRKGVFKDLKFRECFDIYKKQQLEREERAARPKISEGFLAWVWACRGDIFTGLLLLLLALVLAMLVSLDHSHRGEPRA